MFSPIPLRTLDKAEDTGFSGPTLEFFDSADCLKEVSLLYLSCMHK
ncbi:hypothetical protein RUMHYD_02177 [Blautia hydrogenotrophica DSM 10507]|uniref:Uncharacterized protein n=1 Tax=Blautia hydrogenotrophica (strain DSM 10507 / JCM 14656 / S5a33) TaxID=476272 RepID=C0CMT9_BLAHS|nr:hypothetical protein RUMHYD_02177 [Blautia hydrogenotrophica DSM 10507]